MVHFLEQFQDTVAKFPDRVAVVDRDGERTKADSTDSGRRSITSSA